MVAPRYLEVPPYLGEDSHVDRLDIGAVDADWHRIF